MRPSSSKCADGASFPWSLEHLKKKKKKKKGGGGAEPSRVRYDVCPRYSELHRGLCFVRAPRADQMVLTTYGRSSGFCIDPIEKKPLNHFLPGPVLRHSGCNLTCKFCQNWDISKARDLDRIQDVGLARSDRGGGSAKRLPIRCLHLQ